MEDPVLCRGFGPRQVLWATLKKPQTRDVFGKGKKKPWKRTISLSSSSGAGTRVEKDVVSYW